ncbi:MAG: hypothetical protein AAGE52_42260 [Myxococcota bacterium]
MTRFALLVLLVACGPTIPRETLVTNLRSAMEAPVNTQEEAAQHSRVVQDAVDGDALQGLRRFEVEEKLGRGDACSRHPRCGELGFDSDDWFYNVGALGEGFPGPVPSLIVGFDRRGVVVRVWNLQLH